MSNTLTPMPQSNISDLNPYVPLGGRREHQYAVVFPSLPDPPLVEQAIRVGLDGHPFQGGNRDQHDFSRRLPFGSAQLGFEIRADPTIQDAGKIVHVSLGFWKCGHGVRNSYEQGPAGHESDKNVLRSQATSRSLSVATENGPDLSQRAG